MWLAKELIMQHEAKKEIAQAIIDANSAHDATWSSETMKYGISQRDAVEQKVADADLQNLITMLLVFDQKQAVEWAEEILRRGLA